MSVFLNVQGASSLRRGILRDAPVRACCPMVGRALRCAPRATGDARKGLIFARFSGAQRSARPTWRLDHFGDRPVRRLRIFLFSCAISLALGLTAFAGAVTIELPPETASFKPGTGAGLANGQCLVCHSVDYVTMQPASPRAFWAAEVKKMREKYGAQIPPDQLEALTDYLAQNYGTHTNSPASTEVAASPSSAALSGEAVATRYGCTACHNVDVKIVGPPFKAIAAKYQNDPTAVAKITEQIHKGGSGKWGPVIMPPFPMVNDAETRALAEWVLSRK